MLKGHEVKVGDRIVAWSKEAHRYVAVSVWKVNASSCQGKDKNLELYKGLDYKNAWTVEDFQQQKPDDYNSLFGKKNDSVWGQAKLAQSDSLKGLEDSSKEPNLLVDLSGLNLLKSTQTQEQFSAGTITTPSTTTSETISPQRIQQTASSADSLVPEPVALESATDLSMKSQASGGKCTELLSESDPSLLLSSNQKVCDIEDLTSLSAPLPKSGIWVNGSVYQQPTLERPILESESLSLPTPTTYAEGSGEYRPAGANKLDKRLRLPTPLARDEKGITRDTVPEAMQPHIQTGEVMNSEVPGWMMGFPPGYAESALADGGQKTNPQLMQEYLKDSQPSGESALPSTAEASPHNKQQLHSKESSTSIASWIDPKVVLTDAGTQSRAWEDSETIEVYAEKMLAGLWEWERQPLPVVFFDGENYYPGDCHHRIKAAIAAEAELICVDVREGTLRDAIVYSCQANTDHGIPLRPRDQRKRIEMLLDQLALMTASERIALLDKVPNVTESERSHCERSGEWSNRVIARYLKLAAGGYATVCNIQKEREFKRLVGELGLREGDRFQREGVVYAITLLSPSIQKLSVQGNGGIQSVPLTEFLENFTSVEEEDQVLNFNTRTEREPDLLKELEEKSGHNPPQLLPDKERHEGTPLALAREDGSQSDAAELLFNQLMGQMGLLSDAQLQQLIIKAKAELNRRQEYRRSA